MPASRAGVDAANVLMFTTAPWPRSAMPGTSFCTRM